MHIEDKQLTLYAGGGLLASSELNDEDVYKRQN